MKEIWKDIKNYEGYYQVSNLGNVRSLDRKVNCNIKNQNFSIKKGKILKKILSYDNYLFVHLSKNSKTKSFPIHRLVALTFIDNSKNLPQVNHIDGNKQNNCVENLEWCTCKENIQHAWKLGLSKGYKHPKGKLNSYSKSLCKRVSQYDLNGNLLNVYNSISEASRNTPCCISDISNCCNNKRKTSHNFIWKYTNY